MCETLSPIRVSKRDAYFFIKGVIEHDNPLLCTRTILRRTKQAYQKMKRDE